MNPADLPLARTGFPARQGLAGFTVAITAERRRQELATLLERHGARTVVAPALRLVLHADERELRLATQRCIDGPLDVVVVTTGIGFRGWIAAAEGWGLADALMHRLEQTTLLARGPKARGAIRAAGLVETWSPVSESNAEVLDRLLAEELRGRHIAVQLHGEPLPSFTGELRARGAQVFDVPVYRWAEPTALAPLRRLIGMVIAGRVHAVTFTSAPAVRRVLDVAEQSDEAEHLLAALRTRVVAACVGPVTATPLLERGVPVLIPSRGRLGALVRSVIEELSTRRIQRVVVGAHTLELRGHAVLIDDRLVTLSPAPMAILRELARVPGGVVSRPRLMSTLAGRESGEHAIEVAVGRVRSALGDPGIVETVVKRGYRLAAPRGGRAMTAG